MKNDKEKFKTELKQRMYAWVIHLVKFIDALPKGQSASVISHQLLRSGTSICANYIEAQASSSKKDFTNFFHHSLKSANESKFWLALLRDLEKGDKEKVNWLIKEVTELANILGASLLTLKGKR